MSVDQLQNIGDGEDERAAEGAVAGAIAVEPTATVMTAMTAATAATAAVLQSYPVAPGYRLNVRSGPGTGYSVVRVLPEGAKVAINCQRPGEWVAGPYGTSNIWDSIGSGQYVSDAYVRTGSDGYVAPRC
ncbi:SH3 domain-containing protein [Streptomyces sp. NPDC048392]|uniref:SH3 domain-containing protein n=1 Tax=Streptomyces sp. NPDC048392 TaxID=3365543 RepID=UPI003713C99C